MSNSTDVLASLPVRQNWSEELHTAERGGPLDIIEYKLVDSPIMHGQANQRYLIVTVTMRRRASANYYAGAKHQGRSDGDGNVHSHKWNQFVY